VLLQDQSKILTFHLLIQVYSEIQRLFTPHKCFTIKKSRYSNATSTSVSAVITPTLLGRALLSTEEKSELQDRLELLNKVLLSHHLVHRWLLIRISLKYVVSCLRGSKSTLIPRLNYMYMIKRRKKSKLKWKTLKRSKQIMLDPKIGCLGPDLDLYNFD